MRKRFLMPRVDGVISLVHHECMGFLCSPTLRSTAVYILACVTMGLLLPGCFLSGRDDPALEEGGVPDSGRPDAPAFSDVPGSPDGAVPGEPPPGLSEEEREVWEDSRNEVLSECGVAYEPYSLGFDGQVTTKPALEVDTPIPLAAMSDGFAAAVLDDSVLRVRMEYGGGCVAHRYTLRWDSTFSDGVADLTLTDPAWGCEDMCAANVNHPAAFDITRVLSEWVAMGMTGRPRFRLNGRLVPERHDVEETLSAELAECIISASSFTGNTIDVNTGYAGLVTRAEPLSPLGTVLGASFGGIRPTPYLSIEVDNAQCVTHRYSLHWDGNVGEGRVDLMLTDAAADCSCERSLRNYASFAGFEAIQNAWRDAGFSGDPRVFVNGVVATPL